MIGPYFADANCLIPLLSKNLNKHNFTIFDARNLASSLGKLSLPMISEEDTKAEMNFLEVLARMPEKLSLPLSAYEKRKAHDNSEEERFPKRIKTEVNTAAVTQRILALLHARHIVHVQEVSALLNVKETKVQQIADVLSVVGSATVSEDGFITSRRQNMVYQEQKFAETDSFGIFGLSTCVSGLPSVEDTEPLEMVESDYGSHSSVVLPFSRPSSLLNSLMSPTNSNTTTSISSSSSADSAPCELQHTVIQSRPLSSYSMSFAPELSEREVNVWADSIWTQ